MSDESISQAIANYTEQDFRDLQAWFNLAWLDPDFIEADPAMKALVHKARGFTEADKQLVVAKHAQIIREVICLMRMQIIAMKAHRRLHHPIMH